MVQSKLKSKINLVGKTNSNLFEQKEVKETSTGKIALIVIAIIFGLFFILGLIVIATIKLSGSSSLGSIDVAVIPLSGVITTSGSAGWGEDAASSTDINNWIKQANDETNIKAIILEINSPGGSPVASDEIVQAIKKSKKPVVGVIREVGASGAYWAASACDKIYANRMSVTGSIGVIGSYLEFNEFLNDHNITYRRLVAGKYKDIGSPFKEMTSEELELYQEQLDQLHTIFINDVAANRNLSEDYVRNLATGFIYMGENAKELGLIDEIGGMPEAVAYYEQMYNTSVNLVEYKKEETLTDILMGNVQSSFKNIGLGIGESITKMETQYPVRLE